MAATPEPLVYTVAEAAAVLACSPSTVRRAVRLGQLHGVRLGNQVLVVPRWSVEELLGARSAS